MSCNDLRASSCRDAATWAPPLSTLRLIADGRSAVVLSPDASVQWWCAPQFDDPPLCWRLLDACGGSARFPGLRFVDADDAPAGARASTLLRDDVGVVEVRDGLLPRGPGVVLVRLLRRRPARSGARRGPVEHHLRLGGSTPRSSPGPSTATARAARRTAPGTAGHCTSSAARWRCGTATSSAGSR